MGNRVVGDTWSWVIKMLIQFLAICLLVLFLWKRYMVRSENHYLRENNVQTLILRMDLKNGITCPMLNLTGFGEIGLFSPSVLGTLFLITTMRSERTNLACTGI